MVTLAFIPKDNNTYSAVVVRRYTAVRSRMTAFAAPDGHHRTANSIEAEAHIEDRRVQPPSPSDTVARTLKKRRRTNRATGRHRRGPGERRKSAAAVPRAAGKIHKRTAARRHRDSSTKSRKSAAAKSITTRTPPAAVHVHTSKAAPAETTPESGTKPPSPEYTIEPEICTDIWDDGSSDEPNTPENQEPVDAYAPSDEEEEEPDDQVAHPEITSCDIAESEDDDEYAGDHRVRIRRIVSREAPSSDDEPDPLTLDPSDDDDTPSHEPGPLPDDGSFFRRIHIKPPTDPSMTDYKLIQQELNTLAARFDSDESGALTLMDRVLLKLYYMITTPNQ